jgi:acyl-CoA synthetase (AMP-forming)/AMP-acid ligase II
MELDNIPVRRVCDVLKVKAAQLPDRVAHDDTRRAMTFREWDEEADAVAGGLVKAGLLTGERVMLPIENRNAVEMAIATIAVLRAGGIAVPLNTRLSPLESKSYFDLIEPRFAITNIPERIADLHFDKVWLVDEMPRAREFLPDQAAFDPNADAMILGTSGTTGAIKGVVNSHPDLMHLVGDGRQVQKHHNSTLHALPFTSSGGMHGELLLPLVAGATCFTQPKFEPGDFLRLIKEKRPTTLYFVPTMLRLVLDHPAAATTDMSSVRHILTGTAPLPHDSAVRALTLWPHVKMRNSYGMSEGGVGASTKTNESVLKPGCVGPMPAHMEIRNEVGQPVGPGIVGEIYGRAKSQRRYWRDETGSAASWVDGWTRTGDLGFVDADGDLIISGRLKEIIIRGGFNLSPVEIENVLHAHPAVKDAAVVGISHEVLGEDVAAAVTLNTNMSASPEDLTAWCRERIAENKVPRTIVILPALPLNANAKVLKRELKPLLEQADAERRARMATA